MQITISGSIGAGKSTTARMLSEFTGLKYYSVGSLMREMAVKRGEDINEFSEKAEKSPEIDKALDDMQRALEKKENFVMDSRLGFYFLPNSFKVFLDVELEEGARRVMEEARKEESYKSKEEAIEYVKMRAESEKKRYEEYYTLDFPDKSKFDLVIDTTWKSQHEVVNEILKEVEKLKQ